MKKDRNHSEDTYQPSNHHFTLITAPPICSYPLNSPYDVFSSSMLREIRLKFTKHQDGDSIAILMLDMSEIPCLCIVHPTFRSIFQTIQCKELSCTCRQGWGVFHQPFILGNTINSPIIPVDMCSWVKGFVFFCFQRSINLSSGKRTPWDSQPALEEASSDPSWYAQLEPLTTRILLCSERNIFLLSKGLSSLKSS